MKTIKLLAMAMPLALGLTINTAKAELFEPGVILGGTTSHVFDGTNPNGTVGHYIDHFRFILAADSLVTAFATGNATIYEMNLLDVIGPPAFNWLENDLTAPFQIQRFLTAGTYQIDFKYTDLTEYTGGVTIAAVPEPETYAMMLAGLGLIGFSARRRKTQA